MMIAHLILESTVSQLEKKKRNAFLPLLVLFEVSNTLSKLKADLSQWAF